MKEVTIDLKDQVNCRINGMDPAIKRTVRDSSKYFQQYARHTPHFKAGFWDGYEYLIDIGGRTHINQLDVILPILIDAGYSIKLNDLRDAHEFDFPEVTDQLFSDRIWPDKHKFEGEPIILMPHQVEALNLYLQNPHGIEVLPTSAGKTLITAAMSYLTEPYGRSIVVVPSKSLVTQTEADYINIGLDVGVYYGDRKELGHTHTICTWQSLAILSKKSKASIDEKAKLIELLENVHTCIIDETHSAKSKELKNLLTGVLSKCPIRWGLTGTMPRDEYAVRIINNVIGPVIGTVKPKELQDLGHLAKCNITANQLQDIYDFTDYHAEQKYLATDEDRLRWIAKYVTDIAQTGNTLVLVNKIDTGKMLTEFTHALGFDADFIYGATKTSVRKEAYDSVHDSDNMIMYASYGVASIGINIPRIFNLVLFEPGKSYIRVIQSIGRGLRVAKDKDEVAIFDLSSSCKYSKRHFAERKKFYKEIEYPFKVVKTKWR